MMTVVTTQLLLAKLIQEVRGVTDFDYRDHRVTLDKAINYPFFHKIMSEEVCLFFDLHKFRVRKQQWFCVPLFLKILTECGFMISFMKPCARVTAW